METISESSKNQTINQLRSNQANQVNALNVQRNQLIDQSEAAEMQLNRLSFELWGFIGVYTKNFWAKVMPVVIFILIAIAEVPLNATAFEIFERSQVETLIIAILFGMVIALMAHYAGFYLKRFVITHKRHNLFIGILILILTTIGLYVSSELRIQYLAIMNHTSITSQSTQFFMSFFIFFGGVIGSYAFASNVKNLEKEKGYFRLLKQFKGTEKNITLIDKKIDNVNKQTERSIKKIMDEVTLPKPEETVPQINEEELKNIDLDLKKRSQSRKRPVLESTEENPIQN